MKFLAKIVENSDKTKMTSTNMSICFGVSFITTNNSSNCLNTNNTLGNISISSISPSSSDNIANNKYIDMSTATNVFEFLLTNHNELFPNEINFIVSNNNTPKSNDGLTLGTTLMANKNQSFLKKNESFSSNNSIGHNFLNSSQPETASVLFYKNHLNEPTNEHSSSVSQSFKSNNEVTISPNKLVDFNDTCRHKKNNSVDYRISNIMELNNSNQIIHTTNFNNSLNQNE
jgi:hypothetical protein